MAADKLTKGLPARVILETTIVQEEEVYKHSFDEMGRIVEMNEKYYIRFTEGKEDEKVSTLIKLLPDGTMHLTRHGEQTTRLQFNDSKYTYTNYATPAGIMQLRVETNKLNVVYNATPFAGDIEVDYVIYVGDNPLGSYQLRLRFTT